MSRSGWLGWVELGSCLVACPNGLLTHTCTNQPRHRTANIGSYIPQTLLTAFHSSVVADACNCQVHHWVSASAEQLPADFCLAAALPLPDDVHTAVEDQKLSGHREYYHYHLQHYHHPLHPLMSLYSPIGLKHKITSWINEITMVFQHNSLKVQFIYPLAMVATCPDFSGTSRFLAWLSRVPERPRSGHLCPDFLYKDKGSD